MKHLFTLLLCFVVSFSFAQKKQNVYYFNQFDELTENKDSSFYTRIIQEPDSGSVFFNIFEFYKNGKLKKRGNVSSFDPVVYEGIILSFDINGKKISSENFKENILTDNSFYFYSNGKVKEQRFYLENTDKTYDPKRITYKTIIYNDTLGNNFLDNELNGKVDLTLTNGDKEEGKLLHGFKDGVWNYYNSNLNEKYIDVYNNGKFEMGKTIKKSGAEISYKYLSSNPEFVGGINKLGHFLGENLQYPVYERDNGISGNVSVGFFVEKDGTLSDFKIVKSVSNGIDKEALRVVKMFPKWIPAKYRGEAIRYYYVVPVFFQLR